MTGIYRTADGEAYATPTPPVPDVGVAAATVGTHIDKARRNAGWTTVELATLAGVGRNHTAAICRGDRTATVEQARRLCAALGVAVPAEYASIGT